MQTRSRSGALLTEFIVVVLIFTLCASVLVQLFSLSVGLGDKAGLKTDALNEAQNTADRLYASEAPEALLLEAGFVSEDGVYRREYDGYALVATLDAQPREAGTLQIYTVTALQGEDVLFSLPVTCYRGDPDA